MTCSVSQILAAMKRVWLLIGAILINSALAPLIAIGGATCLNTRAVAAVRLGSCGRGGEGRRLSRAAAR